MTTLTIRNVEPSVEDRLRVRAARNGRSMEAELRHIITDAVDGETASQPNLADAIRRRFLPFGGADDIAPHLPAPIGDPPRFEG